MANDTPRTIEIPLTKGYVAIVDECDSDLSEQNWYAHIGITGRVYARRSVYIDGKNHHIWLHKVVYARMRGTLFAVDETVDHIDNNSLNDCRSNLRGATFVQNLHNAGTQKRKIGEGILKGARFHKRDKRWTSSIVVDGKNIHLGSFDTMEQAHEAYRKAAKKYRGKYARWE